MRRQHLGWRSADLDLWSHDLKINREHLLSKGIHCSKFSNYKVIEVLNIEQTTFFQKPAVWPWPFTSCPKNQRVIYFLEAFTVPSLTTFQQRSQEILKGQRQTVWPWPFYVTWKSSTPLGHLLYPVCHFHAKGSKDIERTSLLQFRTAIWPWPLTMWPEINREYLLSNGIHCTKFGNFQAKGSKYIEWTSLRLQADRLLTESSNEGI